MRDHLIGRVVEPAYLPLPHADFDAECYTSCLDYSLAQLCWLTYGTSSAADDVYAYVKARTGIDARQDPAADGSDARVVAETDALLLRYEGGMNPRWTPAEEWQA